MATPEVLSPEQIATLRALDAKANAPFTVPWNPAQVLLIYKLLEHLDALLTAAEKLEKLTALRHRVKFLRDWFKAEQPDITARVLDDLLALLPSRPSEETT